MSDPTSVWSEFLASNRLGTTLTTERVGRHTLTLHHSLVNGVIFWVLRGAEGVEMGGLHAEWQTRRLGGQEVVFGRLPAGATQAIAMDMDLDAPVEVHYADNVYSLTVAIAHDLELLFQDSQGRALRKTRIPSRLRRGLKRDGDDTSYWMRRARLGDSLITVRLGEFELTIHRQEVSRPDTPIFGHVLDHPRANLWAVQRSVLGGDLVQPLRRDCETEEPGNPGWVQLGNPSIDRLDEAVRVWSGTLPPNVHSIEATVRNEAWADRFARPDMFWVTSHGDLLPSVDIGGVFMTSGVFYIITPFTQDVVVMARNQTGEIAGCYNLAGCAETSH